ncbi:hypothetical protein [Luteimonas saliphila]|uniref:hypothetical protein n=1 Tax=Luteimonas saliphila TaxID=2804919 RepID=UPI00192D596F|nr:hypothetical protein [Luteimonas saliphila]
MNDRDPDKPNTEQGLYRKFDVIRTDGSDQPGGKHEGCEYFVLDVTHDPHARAAIIGYARSLRDAGTHPELLQDIVDRWVSIDIAGLTPGKEGSDHGQR